MTFAVSSPMEEEIVVGREIELSRFKTILSARQPVLIMLTGERGSGKTSLLNQFRQEAVAAGWNTAPQNRSESLSVNAESTEESFSRQLQALITSPSEKSFIEKSIPKSSGESSGKSHLLPIVEQMRSRAPFLLLIDGFEAEEELAEWFKNHFLSDVRATQSAVVVIVAERSGISQVESSANQIISLDKIEIAPIRSHFATLGEKLTPPIEKAELEVYITTAHRRPDLLNSLTRVLSLAIKTEET